MAKLLGFDFDIQYKEGSSNMGAYALVSTKDGAELLALVLNIVGIGLVETVQPARQQDPHLKTIITNHQQNQNSHDKYSRIRDELRRKGKLVIGSNPTNKEYIL